MMRSFLRFAPLALALSCSALAGCAADTASDGSQQASEEDELSSVSALSRKLSFEGVVYVPVAASDAQILSAVRAQTKSGFGALRNAQISVNSRELKDVDPSTFVKSVVEVVDTASATGKGTPMQKVKYTYTDDALVPKSFSRRTAVNVAVMGDGYASQSTRILDECTTGDEEARDFQGSIWYVFDPSLAKCKKAMAAEGAAVEADRAKLSDAKTQVPLSEVKRLYRPTRVSLGADKTNKGASYPEYDRLYRGGVQKDKLVIGLVNGLIDHGHGEMVDDSGYQDWIATMRELFASRAGYKLVKIEPAEDLTFTVSGKTVKPSIADIVAWETAGRGPTGFSTADWQTLRTQIGKKVIQHWLTIEAPVKVQIGSEAPRDFAIQLFTYFGADSDSTPHKRAIKNSDVFLYNGHSYIGFGPLDPSRFTASDFPSSYQILFIDGCVSYNYYEKDYIPLKAGGTKNLDLITNGMEAPAWGSGQALGKFLAKLTDGKQASYRDLLSAAAATDSLRVVDGEVDNTYAPATKIAITAKLRGRLGGRAHLRKTLGVT